MSVKCKNQCNKDELILSLKNENEALKTEVHDLRSVIQNIKQTLRVKIDQAKVSLKAYKR